MAYARGFKAEAERLALELREELGVSVDGRLDPRAACAHLAIPVASLTFLARRDAEAAHQLLAVDAGCFSAGTVLAGSARIIVLNDAHHPNRQVSSLAHELAHVLLEHPPGHVIDAVTGCRTWSAEHEMEADWLGGCLLVPRPTLDAMVVNVDALPEVAELLGVSEAMMSWRYNATGMAAQHRRRAVRARRE